jgi:hypothetical protein
MKREPKYRLKWIVRWLPSGWVTGSRPSLSRNKPYSPDVFPANGKEGAWAPPLPVMMCQSGYHVCSMAPSAVRSWRPYPHYPTRRELWVVEVKGHSQRGGSKEVWSSIRGIKRLRTVR